MWLIFSITSALFVALRRLFEKKLSNDRSVFSAGWMLQGLSLPFLAIAVFLFGHYMHLASLPWQFWWPLLLIWLVLYPIQTYFYVRSIREGEFSYIFPLMSVLPVFNIFVSWFLLHEVPTFLGFVGIIITCIAVFILLMPENKNPFKIINYSRAGLFMVIFCVCVAFGSSLDKVAVKVSDPMFYTLMNTVGATIMLGTLAFIYGKKRDDFSYIKKNLGFASLFGLIQALGFSLYILSLNGGLVSYILAIRSSSFIIAAFLGFWVYKEKITKKKIVSLLLIIIGLICLSFA